MDAQLAQLVRTRTASWNDGAGRPYAPCPAGSAYCEAGTGRRIDDIDDVLAALERLRSAVPDTRAEVGLVRCEAEVTVTELVRSATLEQRRLRVVDRMGGRAGRTARWSPSGTRWARRP